MNTRIEKLVDDRGPLKGRYDVPKRVKNPYTRLHIKLKDIEIYKACVMSMVDKSVLGTLPTLVASTLWGSPSTKEIKAVTRSLCKLAHIGILTRTSLGAVNFFSVELEDIKDRYVLSKIFEEFAKGRVKFNVNDYDISRLLVSGHLRLNNDQTFSIRYTREEESYEYRGIDDEIVLRFKEIS